MAALVERDRTGKARRVEINMIDATLALMPDPFGYHEFLGLVADPYTSSKNSQSYAVPCGDGTLLCIHLSSQPQFWDGLVKALDLQEFANDPRVATRMLRIENYDLIAEAMAARTRTRPREHWMQRLEENDVPFAPILDVTEVPEDPQVRHLGSFTTLEHPKKGRLRAVMRPIWLDGTRQDQPTNAPPLLGEHTAEVLAELGLPESPDKG
jgi:formyl-CoA transferase